MYKLLHQQTHVLGMRNTATTIETNELLLESLDSYRESIVRNRRSYYVREVSALRYSQAKLSAELSFIPLISKYVIESSIVIGALFLCAFQFFLVDARHAVGTLAIFIAASTRIAPAVLRVQQGALGIRGAYGSANPTLDLIESLRQANKLEEIPDIFDLVHDGFEADIVVENLSFTYPGNNSPTIQNLNLKLKSGEILAIVGTSGAGKTTLVDLILGVATPSSGRVRISQLSPLESVQKWPGAISYVPQNVSISNGSIRKNVTLGYPKEIATDRQVLEALQTAQLRDFVESLPEGLETQVGERGTRLSGGQRQRLGIARAVFTNPKLLIFDEATSSLDNQTEAELTTAINGLKGSATVIVIAHRLSTVRNCDRIIYMENGEVIAEGSFEEVRAKVPNFEAQAKLAGM
jgi:ABC-type multidrug transport system fused ATPase/permease subunit